MNQPRSKLSVLRDHMDAGRWPEALSIAARFPDLGEHRAAITRAHGALTNPRFFSQIGDCAGAIEAGKAALLARYCKAPAAPVASIPSPSTAGS